MKIKKFIVDEPGIIDEERSPKKLKTKIFETLFSWNQDQRKVDLDAGRHYRINDDLWVVGLGSY